MPWTVVAFLVATSLYAGFQWTVRIVVYPQFSGVGAAEFARYERAHQQRVTLAVGPLFACLVLTTGALVVRHPSNAPAWTSVSAVALLSVILSVTALLAVPLHRTLAVGFDESSHRRLLAVDSIRLAAALLDVALAGYLATL